MGKYRKAFGLIVCMTAAASQAGENRIVRKKWTDLDLKKKLSSEQYRVTQQCGTEPPFRNAYWDNHRDGIYVDVVSGEPLFSSRDKFDSGSGWPSFTKPIRENSTTRREDRTIPGMPRIEIRSKDADSHLGHVFEDGPGADRLRFCINSAALRFVPLEAMEQEGYGEFISSVKK